MSQTTTNFTIPYPEDTDTRSQVIQSTADGIILIDEILKSISDLVGSAPGDGLEVVAGKLQVKNGFGLVFDSITRALKVDTTQIVNDSVVQKLRNHFDMQMDHVNATILGFSGVGDVNAILEFSPSFNPKPIKVQITDNSVNTTLCVSLSEVANIDLDSPKYRFMAYSENTHYVSAYKSLPVELDIDGNDVLDFKLAYANGLSYPGETDKFVLAILRSSGSIEVWLVSLLDVANTLVSIPVSITAIADKDVWDIQCKNNILAIVYCNTLLDPKAVTIDLATILISPPINLYTIAPTGDVTSMTVCVDDFSTFTAFYLEAGAPIKLHADPFIHGFGSILVDAQLSTSLLGNLKSVGITNAALVAGISTGTNEVQVYYHPSTLSPTISSEAVITAHTTDRLWGFVRSTSTLAISYRPLEGTNSTITYSTFTSTNGSGPTTSVISSTDVAVSDSGNNLFLSEIPDFVSNFIFSPISTPSAGMVFYFSDLTYHSSDHDIRRVHCVLGGLERNDYLPDRWPMSINVQYIHNPRCNASVLFPSGSSFYDLDVPNGQLAYIEFQDSELSIGVTTNFYRDITLNNPLTDLYSGVIFENINAYVHNYNRQVLFYRFDDLTKTNARHNDVYIYFGNEQSVNARRIYESEPNKWSGPGLIGSGSSQRVYPGAYVTFDEERRVTLITAQSGLATIATLILDSSGNTYSNMNLTQDTESVFREAVRNDLIPFTGLPVTSPVVFQFRLPGFPTLIGASDFKIYEAAVTTLVANPDAVLAINAATEISIPIAQVQSFVGDTLLISEPVGWIPDATKAYVVQYKLTRPTTGTQYKVYVAGVAPSVRALSGGSILPTDGDWGLPGNAIYRFYGGPVFPGPPVADAGLVVSALGIIHKIETAALAASSRAGVLISDSNGMIPLTNLPEHNDLSGLQGGSTSYAASIAIPGDWWHLNKTRIDILTDYNGLVADADTQHKHSQYQQSRGPGGSRTIQLSTSAQIGGFSIIPLSANALVKYSTDGIGHAEDVGGLGPANGDHRFRFVVNTATLAPEIVAIKASLDNGHLTNSFNYMIIQPSLEVTIDNAGATAFPATNIIIGHNDAGVTTKTEALNLIFGIPATFPDGGFQEIASSTGTSQTIEYISLSDKNVFRYKFSPIMLSSSFTTSNVYIDDLQLAGVANGGGSNVTLYLVLEYL